MGRGQECLLRNGDVRINICFTLSLLTTRFFDCIIRLRRCGAAQEGSCFLHCRDAVLRAEGKV